MNESRNTDVVIVGGGQAGLAMSRSLTDRSIDHVVLERGEVAHSWITERWDSLRLLTPNWLSRLPGFTYDGPDPDGYMTAAEVASHLRRYRDVIDAPVVSGVTVERIAPTGSGFLVHSNVGEWSARSVVIATGACSNPRIPAIAASSRTRFTRSRHSRIRTRSSWTTAAYSLSVRRLPACRSPTSSAAADET